MSNPRSPVIAAAWCALLASAAAQPVVNNQDEVVYVDAAEFADRGIPPRGDGEGGGSAEGRDGILTIFRSSDKREVQNYVVELVELRHAPAAELEPYLEAAVLPEKGSVSPIIYTAPDGTVRHFVQIVTTRAQMPSVLQLVAALDLPGFKNDDGRPRYEVRMRYRRASDVADVLRRTTTSSEGVVEADDFSNTVHIHDTVFDTDRTLRYIRFYDVPPLAVTFDVQLIEVREDRASRIGLDWNAWKRGISGTLQVVGGPNGARLDWLLALDAPVLADFLNYAVQRGDAVMQQRVKITVHNQTTGVIQHARSVPLFGRDEAPPPAQTVIKTTEDTDTSELVPAPGRFRKVRIGETEEGIVLSIFPVVGTDLVTAQIGVSANTLSGYDDLDQPLFSRQEFETSVTLQDGVPLHIGTIERQIDQRREVGVPLLMDVPGIGGLFSVESKRVVRSKVFVIATPTYAETVSYGTRRLDEEGEVLRVGRTPLPDQVGHVMLSGDGS